LLTKPINVLPNLYSELDYNTAEAFVIRFNEIGIRTNVIESTRQLQLSTVG